MDLVERAGELKKMLVDFAMSPRFDQHLSAVIAREFPFGVVTDEAEFASVLDHFALQHRLPAGGTVVEAFVAAHPELADAERDMLLGWRDVVEGIFEVTGKASDAVVLSNFIDELTYRTRSNMGRRAFRPLKKHMIIVGRLVRAVDNWLVSGHLATFPASARDEMLTVAAEQAMRNPEAVFRNPAKLAEARAVLAEHHEAFVELFGADLIVVPGIEVAATVEKFHSQLAHRVDPDAEPAGLPALDFPDAILDSGGAAIHIAQGEGLSFYPDHDLLEELFTNPKLLTRRRYRETLSGYLRDPDTSPEPLQRLAARDPGKTDILFTKLLKRKGGFSWETDGEALLRKHKPGYFDGTLLPRTVPLSERLTNALRQSHT